MMKMKIHVTKSLVVLSSLIFLIVGIFIGYQFGVDKVPVSCGELGALHLKFGRENLGITDFGSDQWKQLIKDETELTNFCYKTTGTDK